MGKNKDVEKDLANFFGDDDVDWLADDPSQEINRQARAATASNPGVGAPVRLEPAAPPPVPVAPPPAGPTIAPPPPAEAAAPEPPPIVPVVLEPLAQPVTRTDDAPTELGEAPADDLPTQLGLPSTIPSPFLGIAAAPKAKGERRHFVIEELPSLDLDPSTEVDEDPFMDRSDRLAGLEGAAPSPVEAQVEFDEEGDWGVVEDSEEVSVFADAFTEAKEELPVVRTREPAPQREVTPLDEPEGAAYSAPAPAPTSAAAPPAELVTPVAVDSDLWRAAATELLAAAEASGQAEERGALLWGAARVLLRRVGAQDEGAAALSRAALSGLDDIEMLRTTADLAAGRGAWDEAFVALCQLAGLLDGPAAAEVQEEAATVARHHLEQPEDAIVRLRSAVAADPLAWSAWSALADRLAESGRNEERVEALAGLARASVPPLAAEAWYRQGQLLLQLGRAEEALAAFQGAQRAEPTLAAAGQAVEALYAQLGDGTSLARLFTERAEAEGGLDAGWWWVRAARALESIGDDPGAEAAFRKGAEAGYRPAHLELQVFLRRRQRWADLAEAIRVELAAQGGAARAYGLYRLARLLENRLEQPEAALQVWRDLLAFDTDAEPAADAIARLLRRMGRLEELATFEAARSYAETDPRARAAGLYRLGEAAEDAGAHESALEHYRAVIAFDPDHRAALEGAQRSLVRLGRWEEVAEVFAQRAALAESPADQAEHLVRAASVFQARLGNHEAALARFGEALDRVPSHPTALDGYCECAEALDRWADLASALRRAGEHTADLREQASLLYRAGRVFAARTDRLDDAMSCLRGCLLAEPGNLSASDLLLDLSGRLGPSEEAYRLQLARGNARSGDRRAWRYIEAAHAGDGLPGVDPVTTFSQILEERPDHPGAVTGVAMRHLVGGNRRALVEPLRKAALAAAEGERAEWTLRLVDAQDAANDLTGAASSAAALVGVDAPAPRRALARIAGHGQDWSAVAAFLEGSEAIDDRLERARLLGRKLGRVEEAVALYADLLEVPEARVRAAVAVTRLPEDPSAAELRARAGVILAEEGEALGHRAFHTLSLARAAEAAGDHAGALVHYRALRGLREGSLVADEGARRCLIAMGDVQGLRELLGEDPRALALALGDIGHHELAVEAWEALLASGEADLADHISFERTLAAAGAWRKLFDRLGERAAQLQDTTARLHVEGQRRWILAEKLSDTEDAWALYQSLHEANPGDREVTETLARIAAARGDVELGVGYLKQLARSAPNRSQAAAAERRVGEVYERAGRASEARQAYLDALDHDPTDTQALSSLRRLATAAGDWQGMVTVLEREAAVSQGADRLRALHEVARVTDQFADDPRRSIDAWRRVLESAPADSEAVRRLVELSAGVGDWGTFTELAPQQVGHLEGAARTELCRRIGVALADELGRDDAAAWFERALTEGPPDPVAAERLEALCRAFGDMPGAVRCLKLRAEAAATPAERAAHHADAAHIEASIRHDLEAAERLYRTVLADAPEHEAALRFLAERAAQSGDTGGALEHLLRLEARLPTDPKEVDDFDARLDASGAWYNLADALEKAGRAEEAALRYDHALELNPTHLASLRAAGPLYIRLKQWRKAERVYRQLIQLVGPQASKAELADMYAELGAVETELGAPDKAAKRFTKALELHPNHLASLKGTARILEERGDWNTLLNYYNNIIFHATRHEDVIDGYLTKGRILDERLGRPDKAAQHYERALAVDAHQPVALLRLAELALRRSDWAEAGGFVQRGLQVATGPTEVRALLLLGWSAARRAGGDDSSSKAALIEASAILPGLIQELGAHPTAESMNAALRARLPK